MAASPRLTQMLARRSGGSPGRLAGGCGRAGGAQNEVPDRGALSPQGRSSAGAQLAGAGLREGGAAARDAEKARGEHCLAGEDQGAAGQR